MNFANKLIIYLILSCSILPASAKASFDRNNLISDNDMENYEAMSLKRISSFLDAQGGALANYITADLDGTQTSAAEIIYQACQKYKLSPKFILTHLQKESSLVSSGSITSSYLDWAMGYAVCDGCAKTDPGVIKYKGFAKQIYGAAERIRNSYLTGLDTNNSTLSGWGVGQTKNSSDNLAVTPQNKATAVLYTYTPWVGYHGGNSSVGGNSLFYDIWQRWFPSQSLLYPSGTLLQSNETGTIYLIKGMQKLPFSSKAALVTNYELDKVIGSTENTLDQYTLGTAINFPEYSLLRSPKGTVYIYAQNEVRGIESKAVLKNLGINPEEIMAVAWSDLKTIPEGEKITQKDVFPTGALLQIAKTGAVYYIDSNGIRHAIWDRTIMRSQFGQREPRLSSWAEIKSYPKGAPLKLKDGELVKTKTSKKIYVIANGYRRPFASREIFDELGYKWNNIITISESILKLHPRGNQITGKKEKNK